MTAPPAGMPDGRRGVMAEPAPPPATPAGPRFTVDPWDPAYGVAVEVDDLESSTGEVDVGIEVPASDWRPIDPGTVPAAGNVVFVDGVRRIDAHVWIDGGDDIVHGGICASYAAGAIACNGSAQIVEVDVGRGVFSAAPSSASLATSAGLYQAHVAVGGLPAQLSLAVQLAMGRLEVGVAERACSAGTCDLIAVDGPLRGRDHLPNAIGFVKTHHVAYLPPEQHRIVARLEPRQRTPIFTLGTSWTRFSWYLRLPGETGSPWSGVVRCECSPQLAPAEATALANLSAATLPRFASEAHKDPRAPQNLYPIGALEHELRRRLGDRDLVYRALRVAAHASAGTSGGGRSTR